MSRLTVVSLAATALIAANSVGGFGGRALALQPDLSIPEPGEVVVGCVSRTITKQETSFGAFHAPYEGLAPRRPPPRITP